MVAMLIGAYLFVYLKTSMTGFYQSFNFDYRSNRMRRMCLIQLASAEDKAKTSQHRSPCSGLVLRGRNIDHEANLKKRHEFQD